MNSRRKGKSGELEAAHELARVLGVEARRGCQFQGGPDSPDVVIALPGVHFEVKRVERLNLVDAIHQAGLDAGDAVPVVLHRPNRWRWMITVHLHDLPRFAAILNALPRKAGPDVPGPGGRQGTPSVEREPSPPRDNRNNSSL